jgi:hypothetical protein
MHRGGNRQLNAALYRIAIVQQRHHPQAKAYLARKIAEGKTARDARRALKRHLANVVYRRLLAWANTCPSMNLLENRALPANARSRVGLRTALPQLPQPRASATHLARALQLHP